MLMKPFASSRALLSTARRLYQRLRLDSRKRRRWGRSTRQCLIPLLASLLGFSAGGLLALSQAITARDCAAVLKAKDYYSYAEQNNLELDWIRSIDYETWQQLKTSNDLNVGLFSGGPFSLSDDYAVFDQKRMKYLESAHYFRTQNDALNILSVTVSPRAFPAYQACLERLNSAGLVVWAGKEDANRIELHVKYSNPAGVSHMKIQGWVSGGTVEGAPRGRLWKGRAKWGVNQERIYVINRLAGSSETDVIIAPDDGSPPYEHAFNRADATLTLMYIGTTDVLRVSGRRNSAHTPNNNNNRGDCPREVGHDSGKYCISRTSVSMTTSPPEFFKNVSVHCEGHTGCPWTSTGGLSISGDGLTASGFLDNWGWDVDAVLTADEYEHMSAAQCGVNAPLPLVAGQTITLAAPKDCLPIAVVRLNSAVTGDVNEVAFGSRTLPGVSLQMLSIEETPSVVIATYELAKAK